VLTGPGSMPATDPFQPVAELRSDGTLGLVMRRSQSVFADSGDRWTAFRCCLNNSLIWSPRPVHSRTKQLRFRDPDRGPRPADPYSFDDRHATA